MEASYMKLKNIRRRKFQILTYNAEIHMTFHEIQVKIFSNNFQRKNIFSSTQS